MNTINIELVRVDGSAVLKINGRVGRTIFVSREHKYTFNYNSDNGFVVISHDTIMLDNFPTMYPHQPVSIFIPMETPNQLNLTFSEDPLIRSAIVVI
jgi:hypothetical protein